MQQKQRFLFVMAVLCFLCNALKKYDAMFLLTYWCQCHYRGL